MSPQLVCEPELENKEKKQQERRRHRRHPGRATAELSRESDPRRTPVVAAVANISVGGVGLVVTLKLEHGEQVKVRLKNDVQRYNKEVRGIVRWVQPVKDKFQIGIELMSQLTSLDLQILARQGSSTNSDSGKVWL